MTRSSRRCHRSRKPLAVRIDRAEEAPRYIHGYISHLWAGDFSMSEGQKSLPSRAYRVRIVPWLWFLTRAARCFVYLPQKEQKSIKEVFDEVIKRVKSYGHVETWHDAGGATILSQRKVEHCVQYRETDFNFSQPDAGALWGLLLLQARSHQTYLGSCVTRQRIPMR